MPMTEFQKWQTALREWNKKERAQGKPYCIPRKNSSGYKEVKRMMRAIPESQNYVKPPKKSKSRGGTLTGGTMSGGKRGKKGGSMSGGKRGKKNMKGGSFISDLGSVIQTGASILPFIL